MSAEYSLGTILRRAIKVVALLMLAVLRHPGYKASRNKVGNFMVLDNDGKYCGYIDYLNGEVELFEGKD